MNFERLAELGDGFLASRLLQVAAKLRIFDALAPSPLTVQDFSHKLCFSERGSEIILNALAGLGLLRKDNGKYGNTETAQTFLVSSSPKYYGHMLIMQHDNWKDWDQLEAAIRTGKTPFETKDGRSNGTTSETFVQAMHAIAIARGDAEILADEVDLSKARSLLDVGGGPGTFAAHFCLVNPNLECAIMDRPDALKTTEAVLKQYEIGKRIRLLPSHYLTDDFPGKFDAVFMSNVLHQEDEHDCQLLLRKAYGALNDGGRVIIKDYFLGESGISPLRGVLFSLRMLLYTKGQAYTLSQLRTWLYEAGFQDMQHNPPEPPLVASIVTAFRRD